MDPFVFMFLVLQRLGILELHCSLKNITDKLYFFLLSNVIFKQTKSHLVEMLNKAIIIIIIIITIIINLFTKSARWPDP